MTTPEYKILRYETAGTLEKAVNVEIARGWIVSGAPFLAVGVWCQAVTRQVSEVNLKEPQKRK